MIKSCIQNTVTINTKAIQNNIWASFHNNVTKIKETLKRNSFPPFLIDKITKSYLGKVHSNSDQFNPESN